MDLSIAKDREQFKGLNHEDENISLENFLKTGTTNIFYKNSPIVYYQGVFYIIYENMLYNIDTYYLRDLKERDIKSAINSLPDAIFLNFKGSKNHYDLIINADMNDSGGTLVDLSTNGFEFPTISFACLARFYHNIKYSTVPNKFVEEIAQKFISKELSVVDFYPDKTYNLTKAELKQVKKVNDEMLEAKFFPKKLGFTLIFAGNKSFWHRASSVLIKDNKEKFSIIIGQDEGTYFGSQLVDNPKSMEDGFTSLKPKSIRNLKKFQRQGEWFIIPVAKKDVPKVEECLCTSQEYLELPRDSVDSNIHEIKSTDIRVSPNGKIYANNGSLIHSAGEHEDVTWKGWVTFVKNTAVRSFSQSGVD